MPDDKTDDELYDAAFNEAIGDSPSQDDKEDEVEDGENDEEQDNPDDNQDDPSLFEDGDLEDEDTSIGDDVDYKALLAETQSELAKERQRTSSWEGRIRKANERAQEAERKLTEQTKKPSEGSPARDEDLDSSDPDLKAFIEEFPDLRKPIETLARSVADKIVTERLKDITPRMDAINQKVEESDTASHYRKLDEVHPDWRDIVQSGNLDKWIGMQPGYIQDTLNRIKARGSTAESIQMLDSFKKFVQSKSKPKQETPTKSQRKVENLTAVSRTKSKPPDSEPSKDDFDSAWDEAVSQ